MHPSRSVSAGDAEALARHIVGFCRVLRHAGLARGTDTVIDALRATALVGVSDRSRLRDALRTVLVKSPSELAVFESAFELLMGRLPPGGADVELQEGGSDRDQRLLDAGRRLLESQLGRTQVEPGEWELDHASPGSYSPDERLATRDFEQMSVDEMRDARLAIAAMRFTAWTAPTRRYRRSARGRRLDMAATLRAAPRSAGELVRFVRSERRSDRPRVVLLGDVSGSMSLYARMFLLFAHALAASGVCRVEAFVFATRLTRVTGELADRDADAALRRVSATVTDWDSGTRIAESLHTFNREWSRRVLSRPATVVLLTDGLERDRDSGLGFEMARLRRSCHRLVWINPLLRFDAFEPRAQGIREMIRHVDEFRPGHSLDSLRALADGLSGAFRVPVNDRQRQRSGQFRQTAGLDA